MLRANFALSDDERGRPVAGGTDVELPEGIGHDRAGEHVLDRRLLAVAGTFGFCKPVAGVLDLHLGEVLEVAPWKSIRRRAAAQK